MLATTILLILAEISISSFFDATLWIGVVNAADAIDVFGVLAAVALIADDDPVTILDFFFIDFPNIFFFCSKMFDHTHICTHTWWKKKKEKKEKNVFIKNVLGLSKKKIVYLLVFWKSKINKISHEKKEYIQ